MEVAQRIEARRDSLTPVERRVAEAVLGAPERVAFGTVAELARAAGTSGASVMRFATALGFDGFSALQASIQRDLGQRLRPATARIRNPASPHVLDTAAAQALHQIEHTFASVDRRQFTRTVGLLADTDHTLALLAGDAAHGIAAQASQELAMLRAGVTHVAGNEVQVRRQLADLRRGDVVLAVDVGRYDRWLVDALTTLATRRLTIIALSDAATSPLARLADVHFTIGIEGVGPFDSYLGALALLQTLTAAVAAELRTTAVRRLDHIEESWHDAGALLDE